MSQDLSRRRFLRSAAALAAGAVAAACGATPTPLPAKPAATPAPVVDTGPLRVLYKADAAFIKYCEDYSATRFGPKNNGAKVNMEMVSTIAEFAQKLLSGMAAGDQVDVWYAGNTESFAMYAGQGMIMPLDDLISRDGLQTFLGAFLTNSLDAGKFKGKQYGIPFGAHPSSRYLFYNKTALGKKGIQLTDRKWKWADYRAYAKTMVDPANKVFGSWLRLNVEGFTVGLRSLGTDIIDSTGTKSLINTPEARPFFQMAYDLISEKLSPPMTEVSDWKPPFAAQKIMMANDNGQRGANLRQIVKDFEWGVWVTPNEGSKPRGLLVTAFMPISAFSKHKELAWQWTKGLLDVSEGVKRVKDLGFIPLPHPDAMLPASETFTDDYTFYIKEWMAEPPLPFQLAANGRVDEMTALLGTNTPSSSFDPAWLKTDTLDNVIKNVHNAVQAVLDKPPV
jgi:ABC-type glycerol-3-phosphate transport system substrate-binding protein